MDSQTTPSSGHDLPNLVNDLKPNDTNVTFSHDDIPEDVWDLLNEMENSGKNDATIDEESSDQALPVPQVIPSFPCLESSETNFIGQDLLNDIITLDAELNTPQLNEPNHSLILQSKAKGNSVDLPFDFPLDVNTPDVDIGILTSNIDFSVTPAVDVSTAAPQFSCEEPIASPSTTQVTENVQEVSSPVKNLEIPGSDSDKILTLSIGNSTTHTLGKGAKLQMKRSAASADKVILTTKPEANHSAPPVTTIIVHLVNNSSLGTKNIIICDDASSSSDSAQPSPAKKLCPEEKQLEMRKKNNEASRRSRLVRKNREKDMASLAEKLENDNKELRVKVEQLTRLRDKVKAELVNVLRRKL